MSDLISRQAAIDALGRVDMVADTWCDEYALGQRDLWIKTKKALEELPSAQPEITLKDVEEYCHKRCLSIVTNELAHEMKSKWSHPEIIRCKDCKHFHYDMPYVIQGVPVLGHEVCDFWGDGCKTSENGFCSYAERRTDGQNNDDIL